MAPLDWGIGHATRCVPVIRLLLQKGVSVTLVASGQSLAFLKVTFPEIDCIRSDGLKVAYPEKGSMTLKMALSTPGFLAEIYREHRALEELVREYEVDAVISDNRFGYWSKKVPSVYLTHQLLIRMPAGMKFLEPLTRFLHGWFIRKYAECWIPDMEGSLNLSGDLSHKYDKPSNAHFIGPLTRFRDFVQLSNPDGSKDAFDLLVLLSGPEPQRSILERIVRRELGKKPELRVALLQGIPGQTGYQEEYGRMTVFSHLPDYRIASLIRHSRTILCRPGYSTVMDLAALKRTALLVPTPGQTEQEYLGRYLEEQGWFRRIAQHKLSMEGILEFMAQEAPPMPDFQPEHLMETRVEHLLEMIRRRKATG